MNRYDEPCELDVTIKAVTDRAILVRPDDDPELEAWLPKSMIWERDCKYKRGARGTIVIPEDLARKKDLA